MLGIKGLLASAVLVLLLYGGPAVSADPVDYVHTRDVIYGRKFGMALTMDVFAPRKGSNGVGVIGVVSSGWRSDRDLIQPIFCRELLGRGYTVFAVMHGSQPIFTIPDTIKDVSRAVRFIRSESRTYRIDPERLGILGASSGGHLSLMQGVAGGEGDVKAQDPVERLSSRVQAVGCFCAPTDFLNYGRKGNELIDRALRPPFTAAVDYKEFDSKKSLYVSISDKKRLRAIARDISPITHVNASSAPTLMIHGDRDELVPLQQSEAMLARLDEAGVPAKLIVRKGIGHGNLIATLQNMTHIAQWFDTHLVKREGR
jgi:acetyl esterase/lipase